MDTSPSFNTPQNSRKPNSNVTKLFNKLAVLVLLLLLCGKSKSAICPSNVTSSTSASTQLDTFTGYSGVQTYNVEVGPVSSALYFMYLMYDLSSSLSAFVKLNSDGTKAWSKSVNFKTLIRSLAVDNTENSVYFIKNSGSIPLIVGRLKASDGTLVDAQSHPSFCADRDDTKVLVLSDNTGYYVIQIYTDNIPHVLKYSFSSPTNQHYKLNDVTDYAYGTLMINDTELFCIVKDNNINRNAVFMKLTFANTSADWANQMSCSGSCSIYYSASLLSTDKSKIYSLFSYAQSSWNIYFSCFQTSNGAIVGNRYKSTTSCSSSYVYGSVLNGDNIFATLYCSPTYYLLIYNIPADSFTFKSFSDYLYDVATESGSGRLIVVGYKSPKGYVAKFQFDSLALLTDFTTTTSISMSIYTDTVTNPTVTLTSQSDTVADYTSSVTVQDAIYSSAVQFTSDAYIQTDNQTYSLLENTTEYKTPDLSCSTSGTTSINYSIANYIVQAPLWVNVSSTSGQLTINTPNVDTEMTYSFYINSNIANTIVKKLISITVLNCAVKFCTTCVSTYSTCSVCNAGYSLTTTGTCLAPVVASETAKAISTTTQATTGSSSLITVFLGMINTSSMSNIWSMSNQIQLLNLLLLSRAYLPKDVTTVIKGPNYLSNPASIISIQNINLFHFMYEKFDSNCSNSSFKTFGLSANSSVLNTSSFFISLILMVILHIIVVIFKKLVDNICYCDICCCPITTSKWILDKCMIIMTYGYYIRFIMQMHQFLLVYSIYEIYNFKIFNLFNIISFCFAALIFILCLIFIGIVLYLSLSSYETSDEEHNKIGEFFIGIKMEKRYKFFITVLILRRTIFVILLITLMSISSKLMIIILCVFQISYLIYVIILRPYKEIKSNIIEIINEIYYLIFLSSLIFLNEEKNWNSTKSSVYCYAITSNTFVMMIIILIDGIKVLIIKLKGWLCKPSEPASGVIQLTPEFLRRIGAPPIRRVTPLPQSTSQTETEVSRNQRYMNEENKADVEDVISNIQLERRKF